MNKEKGFSLIELLIVVAIIGIVSAIAIPSLVNAKKSAYEANAIRYLKSWVPGQEMYRRVNGFYADTDEALVINKFVNKALNASNTADDTAFTYSMDSSRTNPDGTPNSTVWFGRAIRRSSFLATNSYYIDQTGVLRVRQGGNAFVTDPPIE